MKSEGSETLIELSHVGLDQQVPHLRKFEGFIVQQGEKVSEPLLLEPQRSHHNQREAGQSGEEPSTEPA